MPADSHDRHDAGAHAADSVRIGLVAVFTGLGADEALQEVVMNTASYLSQPIAAISLLDDETQWLLTTVGLDVTQTPVEDAFCRYTVRGSSMVVADALADPRFSASRLVAHRPYIRSYAGCTLNIDGHPLGALCVMNPQADALTEGDLRYLAHQAELVCLLLEQRRALHAVQQHAKRLEEFTQRITHDLASPARRAATCAQLAREALDAEDMESVERYLAYTEDQARDGMELVQELHRFLTTAVDAVPEATHLPTAVHRAWQSMAAHEARLDIVYTAPPRVMAHPVHLRRVLRELFSNAVKFAGDSVPHVIVSSYLAGDTTWIVVRDHGTGISPANRERVREPLQRLVGKGVPGRGLGLTSAIESVGAWGGELIIESPESGPGAVIRVSAPRA